VVPVLARTKTSRQHPAAAPGPLFPDVDPANILACPIETTLQVLGRKWALLILRDVAVFPGDTFGSILRRHPGMSRRVLSMRLGELTREGILDRSIDLDDDRVLHYYLSGKGMDTLPILTGFASFGMKHFPDRLFRDGRTRTLEEVFHGLSDVLLGDLYIFAHQDRPVHLTAAKPARAVTQDPAAVLSVTARGIGK
jgi:DNA-binding HxlR family transcriptional regulator